MFEREELYGWKGYGQLAALFAFQGTFGVLFHVELLRSDAASWSTLGLILVAAATALVFWQFRLLGPTLARFELVFMPQLEAKLLVPLVAAVIFGAVAAALAAVELRSLALKLIAAVILLLSLLSIAGAVFSSILLRRERAASRRMRELFERFRVGRNPGELRRIELYLEQRVRCATPGMPIRGIEFPGLMSRPWHDPASFAWMSSLEDAHPVIREEILSALDQPSAALKQYDYFGVSTPSWKSLMLFSEPDGFIQDNCERLPRTMAVLRSLPIVPAREVMVSVLAPRSSIPRHRDSGNTTLTCQLAIQIPAQACGIRVGRERREWTPGETIVFDTAYEHEVWNDSDETRIVFLFDSLHPDLTETERAFFQQWSQLRRASRVPRAAAVEVV